MNTDIHFDPIIAAVNEAAGKSLAYHRWQAAIDLRDRIYKAAGAGCRQADRANALIRHWSAKWKAEAAAVEARFRLPADIEDELLRAESLMESDPEGLGLERLQAIGNHG